MRLPSLLGTSFVALATASASFAQANDDCPGAIAVGTGVTAFDTTMSTTSVPAWPCALGGSDLWYSYTTGAANATVAISTCGSGYDTAIEMFSGTCGALVSIGCNDDACGLQSTLTANIVNAGTVVLFRIGGFNSNTGTGSFNLTETPIGQCANTGPTPNCLETLYASNNNNSVGGAVFFDLTVSGQNATFAGLSTNAGAAAIGSPVGITVYTVAGSYVPATGNMALWTQVAEDDGTTTAAGANVPTAFTFVAPFTLAPGTYGIAIVGSNATTGASMAHYYTNGTGTNQCAISTDGVLAATLGASQNVPFTGAPFTPRVWNGTLCHGSSMGPIGTPDTGCVSIPSSAGTVPMVSLVGTGAAGDDIMAELTMGPVNEFGYWIAGPNTAVIPAGCGFVCIGGPQYRYKSVGNGELFQFDAMGVSQTVGGSGPNVLVTDGSSPAGVPAAASGLTWSFQGWYRDAGCTTPNQAYNFSNSVRVTFL
jgi:hypothetical protein